MSIASETRTQTNFSLILEQVREAGLLTKRPSFYIIRLVVISLIASSLWVGAGFAGYALQQSQWWIVAGFVLAGLLGIMSAQYGFIAHEASHRQVFKNNKANDWLGLVLANLFAGLSYGFWLKKHNKHHQRPNQIGEDPDIAIRVLSFTTESKESKKDRSAGFLIARDTSFHSCCFSLALICWLTPLQDWAARTGPWGSRF